MIEVWLQNNRRMLGTAAALVAVWLTIAAAVLAWGASQASAMGLTIGGSLAAGAGLGALVVTYFWRTPRLACDGRCLHAYLRGVAPIRIPLEVVECFLLGQGPALLPGEKHAKTETSTLVVKLADKAEEWSHVAVDPRLASWCDSYITIRGTWTEPLNVGLVQRLNERLYAASKASAT